MARERFGVIYYNRGRSCAVRLLVSMQSLRRHFDGPVTILSDGEESDRICRRIGRAFHARVRSWTPPIPDGPNKVYLAKTLYHQASDYETTICLDSDTLVLGRLDELFTTAAECSFVVAQFADWTAGGSLMAARIREWKDFLPEYLQAALRFGPAINCGVVAFHHRAPLLQDWLRLALPGRSTFIPDEVCCQIILHRYPHAVVNGRWNRSCKYANPRAPDTRIVHFHGRKHCRPGLPYAGDLWVAELDRAISDNVASIRRWLPAEDRTLRRFLRSRDAAVTPAGNVVLKGLEVQQYSSIHATDGHELS